MDFTGILRISLVCALKEVMNLGDYVPAAREEGSGFQG